MSYAARTKVSADRSMAEIRKVLSKYKATSIGFAEKEVGAVVMFEIEGRRIKFSLPLPVYGTWTTPRRIVGSKIQIEQEKRRLWRALALSIKAKLESVDSGITTIEQEFLAHTLLPNGQTVGENTRPLIENAYSTGKMPPLMLGFEG